MDKNGLGIAIMGICNYHMLIKMDKIDINLNFIKKHLIFLARKTHKENINMI